MSVKVDISGVADTIDKILRIPEVFDEEITKTLNDEGADWLADVRANTPVDTGDLRRSWTLSPISKNANVFEMELSNNLDYANHIEFGHRQKPGRYVPAIGKRLKADFVKGYYMLRDGTSRLEDRLPASIDKAVARARGRLSD